MIETDQTSHPKALPSAFQIFLEPKGTSRKVECDIVHGGDGAVIFAVYRGKLAEGIDFSMSKVAPLSELAFLQVSRRTSNAWRFAPTVLISSSPTQKIPRVSEYTWNGGPRSTFVLFHSVIALSIDSGIPQNALWFAERLHAFFPNSEEAKYFVAYANTQLMKFNVAIEVIGNSSYVPSLDLRARCCMELGRYFEGESTLDLCPAELPPSPLSLPRGGKSTKGSLACRKGLLARGAGRTKAAKSHFETALQMCPVFWTAFEGLCQLGIDTDSTDTFKTDAAVAFFDEMGVLPSVGDNTDQTTKPVSMETEAPAQKKAKSPKAATKRMTNTNSSAVVGTSVTAPVRATRSNASNQTSILGASANDRKVIQPKPKLRAQTRVSQESVSVIFVPSGRVLRGSQDSVGAPPAAPSRTGSAPSTTTRSKAGTTTTQASASTAGAKRKLKDSTSAESSPPRPTRSAGPPIEPTSVTLSLSPRDVHLRAVNFLMEVLRNMGAAFNHLTQFRLKDAVAGFECLPEAQRRSGWVLAQLGRAYFEKSKYESAEANLKLLRQLEPWRLEGMDTYAVVLWQLEKEVELSNLSHELVEFDKTSAISWFAVGNTFAIKCENDMAVRSFQRAIQLDPYFTWAYTLAGHAYLDDEDNEKAATYFRQAAVIDPRHHNAWYGLASQSFRQYQFENAKFFYQKAFAINQSNALLAMLVGITLQRMEQFGEARNWYERAQSLEPMNPVIRFRVADILHRFEDHVGALVILEKLIDTHPEHSVWVLLGLVYRALGDRTKATAAFTYAEDHKDWRIGKKVRGELEVLHGDGERRSSRVPHADFSP
ncbi:TPR-like protein [Gonapodya prolifera JEL478]|uniref:TPR-like protein n=1 Tax=Gonapodya prolifera (strain JEL478) TaxID=1344416 RepID=A0A139AK18_GONPJ|nr:TPR-like protein [Gonapodya prolifera JEL478]|eukprot:KXS17119.1 TPR-like protein [Gonapodya prolifera JEL478]